ncbi:MAG: T9SS type A sorting domain-containing protein [candidate division KSB1 bacterium]|nr:T9SS type A sorting domain-containing protein [candidate division KSB1 bacterium]
MKGRVVLVSAVSLAITCNVSAFAATASIVTASDYVPAHGSGSAVGTPFVFFVALQGDPGGTYEYRAYVTASWNAAKVWNSASSAWVWVGQNWGQGTLPAVTTNASGMWAGWVYVYIYATVPAGGSTLRVRFRKLGTSTDIDGDKSVTVLSMSTTGAWVEATAAAGTAGLAVLAYDASDNIIGTYAVEDNGVSEGYPSTAGYFKMAVPANTAIRKLEVCDASGSTVATQTSLLWGSGAAGTTTNLDEQQDVSLPVRLSSFYASLVPEGVRLSWVTESELDNRGFYVLRSEGEALPYRTISALIPGAGTSLGPLQYEYLDRTVAPEQTYWYKLRQEDFNGQVELFGPVEVFVPKGFRDQLGTVPTRTALVGGYPNPFNPGTVIRWALASEQQVELVVFDLNGRQVRALARGPLVVGEHTARWDGRDDSGADVPAGVYLCVLRCGDGFHATLKLVKLR